LPGDPIFFQSISNSYLLRRSGYFHSFLFSQIFLDGSTLDGKYFGLSSFLFKSVARREAFHPDFIADLSWLHAHNTEEIIEGNRWNTGLRNPLNTGQFINHDGNTPNVCYYGKNIQKKKKSVP